MANKQSYVVEFLGLEVSESVKGKLVNAEEKLANAVLANTKLRNHINKIHKILKDNGVEYSADELNKCIDSFKDDVKFEKEVEFSTTKKEVISLDINPDLFSECGLDINLDIEDEDVVEYKVANGLEENEVIKAFVSENLNAMVQIAIHESVVGMKSSVDIVDSIIFWTLRGNVSLVNLLDSIVSILKNVKGFNDNKLIKRFIRPISETIKVVDKVILKLSSMSNVSDSEVLEETFKECMDEIMGCLWFISFLPEYESIESVIKTLLLCCLDFDTCVATVAVTEIKEINTDDINRVFNTFEKNSSLLDLTNINTLQDLLNISIDMRDGMEESIEVEEKTFTEEELLNEFPEVSYNETKNTTDKLVEEKEETIKSSDNIEETIDTTGFISYKSVSGFDDIAFIKAFRSC